MTKARGEKRPAPQKKAGRSFAEKVIEFNRTLAYTAALPEGVRVMNPFVENEWALAASSAFYRKYYDDDKPRRMLMGINPGRFGAGLTGVPFTDPKRLRERCGIDAYHGPSAHEPSSVFVYEVIRRFGGEEKFYGKFYIHSICPLGFTAIGKNGREVNYNYYDTKALAESALPFMLTSLRRQIDFGIDTAKCVCLGLGKNAAFVSKLNAEHGFFKNHPAAGASPLHRPVQGKTDGRLRGQAQYTTIFPEPRQQLVKSRRRPSTRASSPWRIRAANRQGA